MLDCKFIINICMYICKILKLSVIYFCEYNIIQILSYVVGKILLHCTSFILFSEYNVTMLYSYYTHNLKNPPIYAVHSSSLLFLLTGLMIDKLIK